MPAGADDDACELRLAQSSDAFAIEKAGLAYDALTPHHNHQVPPILQLNSYNERADDCYCSSSPVWSIFARVRVS